MAIKGWSNATQIDVLELWFRGTAVTAATHMGLLKVLPTAGSGAGAVEVVGAGAYARQAFAQNTTNWAAAAGADPSTIQNATPITFPTATAAWATGTQKIVAAGYFTKVTIPGTPAPETSMLAWFTLVSSKSVDTTSTSRGSCRHSSSPRTWRERE